MATDPVCGMTVNEATAVRAERDEQRFYFCGERCRKKFLGQSSGAPTPKATDKGQSCCSDGHEHPQSEHGEHVHHDEEHKHDTVKPSTSAKYFCPMCPGVESDKPGGCPKCGMTLERNPAWQPPKKVIYTCPMHPEVEQDRPGNCPKCGMALEPKTISGDIEEEDSELRSMTRRFWIGTALTLPVFIVAMAHLVPAWSHAEWVSGEVSRWGQFILSTCSAPSLRARR